MAKALKTQGLVELRQLLTRTRRQYALGRISKPNHDFIEKHLLAVEERIEQMDEIDEKGNELSGSDDTAHNSD